MNAMDMILKMFPSTCLLRALVTCCLLLHVVCVRDSLGADITNDTNNHVEYNTSKVAQPEFDEEEVELQRKLDATRFVVQKILVPIVVSFGVVGNIINIVVLTQKLMRTSSTNTYLTALAIFDILYLTFGLTMSWKHYEQIVNTDVFKRYRMPLGKPLTDTWSNTTVWLTLTFTIERYIGVCHPMKGKRWCTPDRARYITIAVVIIVAIITFPEFFEHQVYRKIDVDNTTSLITQRTWFGGAPAYRWGYVYMNQALFTFLPLLLLMVFNTLLIRAVMRATRSRKAMTTAQVVTNDRQERQNREQQKITIMLISVVIVFLLCQTPQAIHNLYGTYLIVSNSMTMKKNILLTILANPFNLLVQINSSTNFILYSCLSLKFRRTFKRIFCRCVLKRGAKDHIFSEANSDGSKTNLILHHPGTVATTASPNKRSPLLLNSVGGNCARRSPHSDIIPKSKNGYLEVQQGASFV